MLVSAMLSLKSYFFGDTLYLEVVIVWFDFLDAIVSLDWGYESKWVSQKAKARSQSVLEIIKYYLVKYLILIQAAKLQDNNIGHKLLSLMGWSGGGLGKEGAGRFKILINFDFDLSCQLSFGTTAVVKN